MTDKLITMRNILHILWDCFCKWLYTFMQETCREISSLFIK